MLLQLPVEGGDVVSEAECCFSLVYYDVRGVILQFDLLALFSRMVVSLKSAKEI